MKIYQEHKKQTGPKKNTSLNQQLALKTCDTNTVFLFFGSYLFESAHSAIVLRAKISSPQGMVYFTFGWKMERHRPTDTKNTGMRQ